MVMRFLLLLSILISENFAHANPQCEISFKPRGEVLLSDLSRNLERGQQNLRVEDALDIIIHKLPVEDRQKFQELLSQNLQNDWMTFVPTTSATDSFKLRRKSRGQGYYVYWPSTPVGNLAEATDRMVRLIDSLSMAKILRLERKSYSLTYLRGPTGQMRLVTDTLIERSSLQQALDQEAFDIRVAQVQQNLGFWGRQFQRWTVGRLSARYQTLLRDSNIRDLMRSGSYDEVRNRNLIAILPFLFSSVVRFQMDISAAYFTYTLASIALFVTTGYVDYMDHIHAALGAQDSAAISEVRNAISTPDPVIIDAEAQRLSDQLLQSADRGHIQLSSEEREFLESGF